MTIKLAGAGTFYLDYLKFFKTTPIGREILKDINIEVYDSPPFEWNGGRLNRDVLINIKTYNNMKIPVYYTFTNYNIDLTNKKGLSLLNELDNKLDNDCKNGVICVNDSLNVFVKNNTSLTRVCSIIKHDIDITNIEECLKYYLDLEKKYDRIVLRSEHALIPEIYENINLSKYEILFNEKCIYNCPIWKEHYAKVSAFNSQNKIANEKNIEDIEICPIQQDYGNTFDSLKIRENDMSYFNSLLEIGYNNFKIAGRGRHIKEVLDILKNMYSTIKNKQ